MIGSSKILVVDDEPNVCRSCGDILERGGWSIETAYSGNACRNLTKNKSYDVIILDLRMPDITGMKLLEEIKLSHPETSVIIITGYSSVASAVETMKIGASDYIPKPFTPTRIRQAVEQAINLHSAKTVTEEERLICAKDVIKVLERASSDKRFFNSLSEYGSEALEEYNLSWEAKAALLSGDIEWIESHVGKLTDTQKTWLNCRLQREQW